MPIDTRDKRFTIIGLGDETSGLLPFPDGGFTTAADRKMLLGVYDLAVVVVLATFARYYAVGIETGGYRAEPT